MLGGKHYRTVTPGPRPGGARPRAEAGALLLSACNLGPLPSRLPPPWRNDPYSLPMASRFLAAVILLGACCLAPPATASIYAYVDDEGVEHLSDVPDDRRYRLVVPERGDPRPVAVTGARGVGALPMGQRPYHDLVLQAGHATGIDAALLHAVITVESGYNQGAVSAKGASGLMQLLPATARRYGISKLFDPAENIRGGARYLKDLLALFDNDLELALAAYNAGENAVLRAGRRLPPYAETRRYVPLVVAHYNRLTGRGRMN